ncbi:MAG: MBL fold metallo-hydrolase [Candidatus Micrarchaeia archaeon]
MKITFLGTGGGRISMIKQLRQSGGFRIDSKSANIHVDPGPGALIYSIKHSLKPEELDAVIVTHFHIDHCNDAGLLIEGMSDYGREKNGIFIGSKYSIEGSQDGDRSISKYHISKAKLIYTAKKEEKKSFGTAKGKFEIEIIKTKHDEPTSFGFKLFLDGKIIGYTGDTDYFDGLGEKFSGCDLLIINCLRPTDVGIPDHLKISDAIKIIKISNPKKVILAHLGPEMDEYGLKKAGIEIEKEINRKVIFAKDNQIIDL